ncbi:hypothetical protein GSI_08735 [Ganoderma sinense ZZ0214-1]|uniref:BTB domain-containing protein n=1 Tax=Ganoderma sinense ZZ0214-1 TaxID=1077348 RepID=A0A2G8S4K4_9APHY|nr:hypothetical protein GSI_08735 [Ganoderma sinense ZZ0214-1]
MSLCCTPASIHPSKCNPNPVPFPAIGIRAQKLSRRSLACSLSSSLAFFIPCTMDDAGWDTVLRYISEDVTAQPSQWPVSQMTGIRSNARHSTPTQVLTPTDSDETSPSPRFQQGLPQDHRAGTSIVSVSTTFHPDAALLPIPTDLTFISVDGVFFCVHTTRVLASSVNYFHNLVPPKPSTSTMHDDLGPVVPLPEPASVLNVVFHAIYGISCAKYHPALDTLIDAVDAMAKYGLPPGWHVNPSTPLYSLILNQAPVQPIAIYALAAAHDLYDLALQVSSHLLSFALHTLTDDLIIRIGPVYMRRLFFLHLGRLDALKRLLHPTPYPHPPMPSCDLAEQKKLANAWSLASAYLVWNARPGV